MASNGPGPMPNLLRPANPNQSPAEGAAETDQPHCPGLGKRWMSSPDQSHSRPSRSWAFRAEPRQNQWPLRLPDQWRVQTLYREVRHPLWQLV